jgi:ABC-type transport system substrate-binding protein
LGFISPAEAKDYDGIWFMGMNLKDEVLKNNTVRRAINAVIDREHIAKKIMSEEVTPVGLVPNGMLGYDPDLAAVMPDLKYAKLLMLKANLPITDQRLKNMTLLHTNGIKTVAIAKKIQNDLRGIGMKIRLVEVDYVDQEKWVGELASGKHDFFLMGYKAGVEQLFTTKEARSIDSYDLVEPVFKSDGEANFTGYSNADVDKLLGQLPGLNLALKSERHIKLKKINQILYKDLPAIVLFYIEKF